MYAHVPLRAPCTGSIAQGLIRPVQHARSRADGLARADLRDASCGLPSVRGELARSGRSLRRARQVRKRTAGLRRAAARFIILNLRFLSEPQRAAASPREGPLLASAFASAWADTSQAAARATLLNYEFAPGRAQQPAAAPGRRAAPQRRTPLRSAANLFTNQSRSDWRAAAWGRRRPATPCSRVRPPQAAAQARIRKGPLFYARLPSGYLPHASRIAAPHILFRYFPDK